MGGRYRNGRNAEGNGTSGSPAVVWALLLFNVATFAIYGIDKMKARKGKWRIPEATLLLLAFLGGSIGAFAGMEVFHHKTHHRKFTILVPVFLCLHAGTAMYLLFSSI